MDAFKEYSNEYEFTTEGVFRRISGKISTETLNIVCRELIPRDMYMNFANQYFEEELKKTQK